MKPWLFFLSLAFAPLLSAQDSPSPWLTDLGTAQGKARETSRLLLVNFTGSTGNAWSIRLRDEILTKAHFLDYAKDNLVLVELDFAPKQPLSPEAARQNAAWADKYAVTYYPTLLILDGTGRELGRYGYMQGGPKTFVRELRRLAANATLPAVK
jgi:protein disulfide-isomerase